MADILKIVVLASGSKTLLRGRGTYIPPLVFTQKYAFKGNHARVREQQRAVRLGYQGSAGNHGVAMPMEVIKEALTEFMAGRHQDVP
jgi:hypothetical protein